jgi:hypothetical protein
MTTDHYQEVHYTAATLHREAAHHFEQAARHHIEAANADDGDDVTMTSVHAYLAYGHQLQAVHCAELAAQADGSMEEELPEPIEG